MAEINDISMMVGKIIIKASRAEKGADAVIFLMNDGSAYVFHHNQDCCECVQIQDVCGDISDLLGSPLLQAEEVVSEGGDPKPEYPDSWTWTFYKFGTIKGGVTIRWLGESSGYYSESVDLSVFRTGESVPRGFLEAAPLLLAAQ